MQRYFLMSSLDALVALRRYLNKNPGVPPHEAATALHRSDVDYAALDFEMALALHDLVPISLSFSRYRDDLRACILFLVKLLKPWWADAIPFGRARLALAIGQAGNDSTDELQSFRSAGLYDDPAPDEVVAWWDDLAQFFRAKTADDRLQQGRFAEGLSMEYERQRLSSLGIDRAPKWVALDDNGLGYDIQSFDVGIPEPTARLIEVKSSSKRQPAIILSKREWETAQRSGKAYVFHIWLLPAQKLIEMSGEEMAIHVPADRGQGEWRDVEIAIAAG